MDSQNNSSSPQPSIVFKRAGLADCHCLHSLACILSLSLHIVFNYIHTHCHSHGYQKHTKVVSIPDTELEYADPEHTRHPRPQSKPHKTRMCNSYRRSGWCSKPSVCGGRAQKRLREAFKAEELLPLAAITKKILKSICCPRPHMFALRHSG